MTNLYILINELTNGYNELWFIIFPTLAIVCGIAVLVNKNPIISVLFLIGLFLNIACILVLLGLNFLGLSYLLVYVGAVSILFLFILMLISIRSSDLSSSTQNSIPLAILVSILFITLAQKVIFNKSYNLYNIVNTNNLEEIVNKNDDRIQKIINSDNNDRIQEIINYYNNLGGKQAEVVKEDIHLVEAADSLLNNHQLSAMTQDKEIVLHVSDVS